MFNAFAMFESPMQWAIVGLIVVLLFGGSKIPEMMKGLGTGMKEFKKGLRDDDETTEKKDGSEKKEISSVDTTKKD
jgi:sec-independent protein translocase protein TatA